MSFHPKILLYASLKNKAFSSHNHSIIHYHTNKSINDSVISANSQSVFHVSQLSQKCLFGVLVQIKTQTKPTHQRADEGGLSESWLLPCTAQPSRPLSSALPLLPPRPPSSSPCTVWPVPRGSLGPGGHCSQLLPSLNRQAWVQHPEGDLISIYLQGSQGVRGPQGITGPKGATVSGPGLPRQRAGSTLSKLLEDEEPEILD